MNALIQIGGVATLTRLSVGAICFYERERLLHTPVRSKRRVSPLLRR
jgi:DNA-binding transcriptional MerR regulator